MRKEQIFDCGDINWGGLGELFAQMSGKTHGVEAKDELTLPDLSIIYDHTLGCSDCRDKLLELAKTYGIGIEIAPQEEAEESPGG